jgi:hypothetical protein
MTQLEAFMAAIRKMESGSYAGNYSAVGPVTSTGNRARGAYQIMEQYWDAWATEAGLPGAQIQSRAAQDAVARHRMSSYFRQLGDWRLVAIAWFAGMSTARKAKDLGIESVSGISDVLGTTISTYVERITSNMRDFVDQFGDAEGLDFGPEYEDFEYEFMQNNPTTDIAAFLAAQEQQTFGPTPGDQIRTTLMQTLDGLSSAIAGGARSPIGARMAPAINDQLLEE